MRQILHLLTAPADDWVGRLIQNQEAQAATAGNCVHVVDLSVAGVPDYDALLDRIFAADSVTVW